MYQKKGLTYSYLEITLDLKKTEAKTVLEEKKATCFGGVSRSIRTLGKKAPEEGGPKKEGQLSLAEKGRTRPAHAPATHLERPI